MTPTNEQIIEEAARRWMAETGPRRESVIDYVIDTVREGWTPPEPVVDPDILAFLKWHASHPLASFQEAYIAGVWMARKQEQERVKVLEGRLSDLVERVTYDGKRGYVTGVNAGEMISARVVLAKYNGEAQ